MGVIMVQEATVNSSAMHTAAIKRFPQWSWMPVENPEGVRAGDVKGKGQIRAIFVKKRGDGVWRDFPASVSVITVWLLMMIWRRSDTLGHEV